MRLNVRTGFHRIGLAVAVPIAVATLLFLPFVPIRENTPAVALYGFGFAVFWYAAWRTLGWVIEGFRA